ncbi:DUF748 domain-containing protein [Thalassotalea euphylliae]|uniref:DUF748 domain-containing protein n=1 Tax=Thalassotalea euphylliae TaxID=1655234 RepID=UPI0036433185
MLKNRKFPLFTLVFLILLGLLWANLARIANYYTNKSLAELGLEVDIGGLSVNLLHLNIEVSNLDINHTSGKLFSAGYLRIDAEYTKWWQGNIQVADVEIDKLSLSVPVLNTFLAEQSTASDSDNNVANNANSDINQAQQESAAESIAASADTVPQNPLAIAVGSVVVTDSEVLLVAEQAPVKVTDLALENFRLTDGNILSDVEMGLTWLNNTIAVEGSYQQKSEQQSVTLRQLNVDIDMVELDQLLSVGLPVEQGQLSFDGNLRVNLVPGIIQVASDTLSTKVSSLKSSLPFKGDHQLTIESAELKANSLSVSMDAAQGVFVDTAQSSLRVNGIDWLADNSQSTIAKIAELSSQFTLNHSSKDSSLNIEELNVTQGTLVKPSQLKTIVLEEGEVPEPLLVFQQLIVKSANITSKQFMAEQIVLDADRIVVYKSADQLLDNLIEIEPVAAESSDTAASTDEVFGLSIKRLSLVDEPVIALFDHSVSPAVEQEVKVTKFELNGISNLSGSAITDFDVAANIGKRGSFNASGTIDLFANQRDMSAQGSINALNLVPYSPYISEAMGYAIKRGTLYSDFDFSVEQQQISGKVKTNIRAIALGDYQLDHQKEEESTVLPLNTVINQLTDDKGNFELEVPLSGAVDDPNFGLTGLVSLVTTKAIKQGATTYLLQSLVPYATVVNIAMMATDNLFELTVNDLEYAIGQEELSEAQLSYVGKLAQLLKDKPELQLTVCPTVLIEPELNVAKKSELTDKQRKALRKRGQDRMHAFIDVMADQYSVSTDRMIECQTSIANGGKIKPHLAFTVK